MRGAAKSFYRVGAACCDSFIATEWLCVAALAVGKRRKQCGIARANESSAELASAMPSAAETRPKVKVCSKTKNKGIANPGKKNR
jgi:hypothetical protein